MNYYNILINSSNQEKIVEYMKVINIPNVCVLNNGNIINVVERIPRSTILFVLFTVNKDKPEQIEYLLLSKTNEERFESFLYTLSREYKLSQLLNE